MSFEQLPPEAAPGVEAPVRISGSLAGVTINLPRGGGARDVLDCRLVVGILSFARALADVGIVAMDTYSLYRPGARVARTGRPSGHARGMAIDIGRFHLANGDIIDVETSWNDRRRGVSPCEGTDGDSANLRILRRLVCGSAEDQTFQIVLTPHFDNAHRNHVHLELRPDVDWTFLR